MHSASPVTAPTTINARFVNDYQTGDRIRPAAQADIDRAEREGDQHTGAHLDNDGRTIFVDE